MIDIYLLVDPLKRKERKERKECFMEPIKNKKALGGIQGDQHLSLSIKKTMFLVNRSTIKGAAAWWN